MTSITSTGINHFLFNKVKLQNTINITEIQVWINGANIATAADASASSIYSNDNTQFGPGNLIDGVLDSQSSSYDMAHIDGHGWFLLTLDDSYNIKDLESIVIYNRMDDGAFGNNSQSLYDRMIGCEMQIYYNDDLLYNHLISVGRPFYRFDGPAIGNVSSFSNSESSTKIINIQYRKPEITSGSEGDTANRTTRLNSYITNIALNTFNYLFISSSDGIEYLKEVQLWINGVNVAYNGTASASAGAVSSYEPDNANDNNIIGNGYISSGSAIQWWKVELDKYYSINNIESIIVYAGDQYGSGASTKGIKDMLNKHIELRNNDTLVYRTNIEHANHVYRIDGPAIKNVAQYENNFVDGSNNVISHLAHSMVNEPVSSPNRDYAPHVSNMCVNTFNKITIKRVKKVYRSPSNNVTFSDEDGTNGTDTVDTTISNRDSGQIRIRELQIWILTNSGKVNIAPQCSVSVYDGENKKQYINNNTLDNTDYYISGAYHGNNINSDSDIYYNQFVTLELPEYIDISKLITVVLYKHTNNLYRRINTGTSLNIYNDNTLISSFFLPKYITNNTSYDISHFFNSNQIRFDGPAIETFTSSNASTNFSTNSTDFVTKIISTSTNDGYNNHISSSTTTAIARLYFANYYKPETSLHSHSLSLNIENTRIISNTITSSNTTVFDISSSGVLQIPVGTDENIPKGTDAAIGQIRYNSAHDDYQGFQGYNGENWTILSGGERNMDNTTRVENITGTFNKLVWKRDYVDKYLSSHYSGYADTLTAMHAREIQIWVNVGGTLTNVAHTDGTASNSSVDNNGSSVNPWSNTNLVSNINDEDNGNLSFTSDITANEFYTGEKRPSLTIDLSNNYNISDLVCVVFWSRWDAARPRAIFNGRNIGTSLRLFQNSAEVAGYSIQQASKYYRIDGPAISNIANSNFMSSDYGGFDPTKIISTSYDSGDGELPHVVSFERVNMYTSNSLNMTVADEGRVGVNTSLPLHNLHINGDLKVKDGVKFLLDYNFYQGGLTGTQPTFINKLLRTYDASYGVASFMSNYGDGFAFNESHGHINTTYQVNDKHQFALNKAQYYPPTISHATMERIVEPVVDNSNGYWKFNVNNDDYLWKAYNNSSPNTSLFDTVNTLGQTANKFQVTGYVSTNTDNENMTFNKVRFLRKTPNRQGATKYRMLGSEIQVWIGGSNVASSASSNLTITGSSYVKNDSFANNFYTENSPNIYIDITLDATYKLGQLQSVVYYNDSTGNDSSTRGLQGCEVQLIDTAITNGQEIRYRFPEVPVYTHGQTYIGAFRFDGPQISSYTGFSTQASTSAIIGDSINATVGYVYSGRSVYIDSIAPGSAVGWLNRFHEDVSCNVDASGGGWFILKVPEPIYAYGAALGWNWASFNQNCRNLQFYASQNGQFFERIGDYDAYASGVFSSNGNTNAGPAYADWTGPITRTIDYHPNNYAAHTNYPFGIAPFNNINKSKKYQYFAVILTQRAHTAHTSAYDYTWITEFHLISNNSLWQNDSTRNMELPRKFTIRHSGTVIETSSSDHNPGAALAIDNNLVISKDINASPLSNNYNLYQKTFNEVRLTRKKPYISNANDFKIDVTELQIWVNGRNIAPDGKIYQKNFNAAGGTLGADNLTDNWLTSYVSTHDIAHSSFSVVDKVADYDHYITIVLPDSHNIEDIETLLLYDRQTNYARTVNAIIELRNFGNVIYKQEITTAGTYHRFDGPSIGNVRTFSDVPSIKHILNSTVTNMRLYNISFPYDLSYSNAIAENNSVYVDGVVGIADLSTNTDICANIFTIDGSHNFTIDVSGNMTSKGGLVNNTNWDVSANTLLGDPAIGIQSNVIEAKTLNVLSYVTTPPTIDFDFRLNTTENTVYDKISGLKADISGSYVISKTGVDLSNSTLDNCAFIELEPFPIGGSFSIETYVLFKNDNNGSAESQYFIYFGDDNLNKKSIAIYRVYNTNRIGVSLKNGNTSANDDELFYVFSNMLSFNTFYHVVLTVSNTHAYLYINGSVNHVGGNNTSGTLTNNGNGTDITYKTRLNYKINTDPPDVFYSKSACLMKYLRIYQNTTLSSDEVTKLYNTRDSFYDSNASIVDSHISLGSSIDHQNENIGANRLHFPRSGGIGVSGEILQYIGENSKGIQFYHNSNDLSNGTISMDLSVNIGNGFGTIGIGKFVDNNNYTLDVSGSISNMYNTTDVSSIFHKTATTDCSGGIVLNSVNSGLQMLKNDGTNGLFIGQNGTYNSINLNGGSLKPSSLSSNNGNLSGSNDISFVQVDKCNDFVVNGSLITNDYEYNNNDTNVNIATNLGISTGNDKGMQVIQTSSSIRDANNRTFRKLRLYRESTANNIASYRYISLYEIQLWINGTNVAASGTVSGTPVHTGPYTRINDGNFTNVFHADNNVTHPYIDISLNANYNINDIQAALIYFHVNTTNNTWKYRTKGIVLQLYDENDKLLHTSPVTRPINSAITSVNVSSLYRYQGPAWNTLTSSDFTTGTTNSNLSSNIFNNTTYGSYPVTDRPLIAQQFRKIRVQKQRPSTFSNWSGTDDTITLDKSLYMPNKSGTTNSAVDTDALSIIEIQVWVNGTNVALSTNGGVASGTEAQDSNFIASGVNDNQDYYNDEDSYTSKTGENAPFIDIDLATNHNVSDIQSMIVYYSRNSHNGTIRCIGTHVELYDEFDNKVYQSNSVKNPCHALRIDGPAFKYHTGDFFSNRGAANDAPFPSAIISAGSCVALSNNDFAGIVVKVNHEKMNNMLEIINTNGDTTNAGHFVAEPSISVVDSNGNVGINTSAPRAGAKLDIYNAHTPSPGYGLFPVGFTMMFCAGKDKVPNGWLLCDGTTYSTSDYPALGAILGHQGTGTDNGGIYGTTSSGQFKVPDLKEKFPILANTASNYTGLSGISVDTNGQLGNNVCNVNQLASHSHSISSSSITEDHTITVNHVLKTGALAGVTDTNKSSYPDASNTIVDSFSSNTTHMGYIPLHTNIHGQPGDYDAAGNKRRQETGPYFNNSTTNTTLHYGVYKFGDSYEDGGRTKEMFPRIEVKASDANLKPTMNLQNAGGTDHRRPQYTVVNFIMYSGVHETTTYGAKGWSS